MEYPELDHAMLNSDYNPPKDLRLTACYLPGYLFLREDDTDQYLLRLTSPIGFSIDTLAAGIAQGASAAAIKQYLASYPQYLLDEQIGALVHQRHPVLFYAIERNDVDCVRHLLQHGCNANAGDVTAVPALAYAVMRSKWTVVNPVEVVKTLLAFGADPQVIPRDMWLTFVDPPAPEISEAQEESLPAATLWCSKHHRKLLAETLSLSVRYFLYKADQLSVAKARGMQLGNAHEYVALLKVPYLIIGQTYACKLVVDKISSHIGMNMQSPLVLTFAGRSGHGKTELAKQMGELLKVPITVVDCAQMRSDIGLFGARSGYQGNASGSQLNNHLAENDGVRSVVFLDEFDKTEQEVRNSLLLLLDAGVYHDRRNNMPIDASKTIWILATNLGDRNIANFYNEKVVGKGVSEMAKVPHKLLCHELKNLFKNRFGAPMAGRMRNIAPFYPFDEREQAVVTHKFLLELFDQLRQPIDLSPAVKRYPGHVHLAVRNDGKLCQHLAQEYYQQELGARALASAVDEVRSSFFTAFVDTNELIHENMNNGPLMRFTVRLQPAGVGVSEVAVRADGLTTYYRGQSDIATLEDEEMSDGLVKAMTNLGVDAEVKRENDDGIY